MKTMTCQQLGGPCEVAHQGNDHNEIIQAQDRHLKEAVAAGLDDHQPALKDMKGRWKRPVSGLKWYRQVQRDFAALPDDGGAADHRLMATGRNWAGVGQDRGNTAPVAPSTPSFSVRPARHDDRGQILDLWVELTSEGTAADVRYRPRPDARTIATALIERWLQDGSPHQVFVADLGDRVVGFLTVRPGDEHPVLQLPPSSVITDAIVEAPHRRSGIGRALVGSARRFAEGQGAPSLEVGTLALDGRAVAFWRAMGFGDWRVTLRTG